jgi:hypothetical protein
VPQLIVFNPPMWVRRILPKGSRFIGQLSREVIEVRYRHADDNKLYQHDFDRRPGVNMFAVEGPEGEHAIMILGSEGQPLWEDFG